MSKLIAKNVFQLPKMNLLVLTTSAFLLALDVILYKIAIGPAYFQLSFGFLSMACIGYLYGPIWGGLLEMISDILSFTIFGSGAFQIAFLLTAFLGGFIDGLFLYRKSVNWLSVVMTQILVMIFVSLMMDSWLISVLFGTNFKVLLLGRLARVIIQIPLQVIAIFYFIKALEKRHVFDRMGGLDNIDGCHKKRLNMV
ncbi:folate family ECF transporter S component [Lactiplantibacillus plantarum]